MHPLSPAILMGLCLLSGCMPFSGAGPISPDALAEASPATARYHLVAPMLNQIDDPTAAQLPMPRVWPLSRVSGTSARDGYSIANLIDGSFRHAWRPTDKDVAPQAIFDMDECADLIGCTIKLVGAAKVDVSVGSAAGWSTIATDLAPEPGRVDWLALPPTDAAQVRLLFKPQANQPLVVCEVTWYGRRCGGDLPLFSDTAPPSDEPATPDE